MTKIKKILSTAIACMMVISTIFSTPLTVSAATCSSGKSTRTIVVTTKANWWIPGSESITLSQTKGVRTENTYNIFTRRTKTKNTKAYGTWNVSIRATDGSHNFNKKLTGGSLKLNLKPNKTYQITVSWDGTADKIDALSKGSFSTYPTWKVKSTYKVSNYY